MIALRRLLAALVLAGVLADASACLVASPQVVAESAGQTAVSALCMCGCNAHTGALGGLGLTQLAAIPAECVVPSAPRVAPAAAIAPRPALVPPRAIDHVPILHA